MQQVRVTPEEIEARYAEMKKNFGVIGSIALTVIKTALSIQPVPYCDVGCAHCAGHANCSKDAPVMSPKDISDFLEVFDTIESGWNKVRREKLIFSGHYGDPFCGFGEENSPDYYTDMVDAALSFNWVEELNVVTSGYHLKDLNIWEQFLRKVKAIEEERDAGPVFKVTFSVDPFHGKKVPNERIINAIKTMKKVYGDSEVVERFGLIGQKGYDSVSGLDGSEYMGSFLRSIKPITGTNFDKLKCSMHYTGAGRSNVCENKDNLTLNGYMLTRASDGALVISYDAPDNCRYEYELKRTKDGKIDRNWLFEVGFNMAKDALSLKTAPVPDDDDGKIWLLPEVIKENPRPVIGGRTAEVKSVFEMAL